MNLIIEKDLALVDVVGAESLVIAIDLITAGIRRQRAVTRKRDRHGVTRPRCADQPPETIDHRRLGGLALAG
jgi:hypothetical protein